MNDLSKILGKYNLSLFEILINETASVRDLAKKAHYSPAKTTQFVKLYTKNDLVTIEMDGNKKRVSLNRKSPLAREMISLVFIARILDSKTFSEMKRVSDSIGVYGSVVDGTVDKQSDIDLWLVSEKKISLFEAGKLKQQLTNEMGREVSLKTYTAHDIERLKKNDKIFYNELECKSKILWGNGF